MTNQTHFFAYGISGDRNVMVLGSVAQAPSKTEAFRSGSVFVFESIPEVVMFNGEEVKASGQMLGHHFPDGLDFNAGGGTIQITALHYPLSNGLGMMREASEYRTALLNEENARQALEKTRAKRFTFGMHEEDALRWLQDAIHESGQQFDKWFHRVIYNLGNEVE